MKIALFRFGSLYFSETLREANKKEEEKRDSEAEAMLRLVRGHCIDLWTREFEHDKKIRRLKWSTRE